MSFPVTDLERSVTFYRDVLGLTPIDRPPLRMDGAWFSAGACEVHLIKTDPGEDVGSPPRTLNSAARHAAFAVSNYHSALAHLKAAGLEVRETDSTRGQMWIRDPDGHILELICRKN
jgi:catechol 2,3-dioxygenase-like lactoylglutathione lyase family enzyme